MSLFQEDRLDILKAQFMKASKILPYKDLGSEGELNRSVANPSARLLGIQLVLIGQLSVVGQTAVDQVFVSLETIRHLQFFGREIFDEPKFLRGEQESAGNILEAYVTSSTKDLEAAKDLYEKYRDYVEASYQYRHNAKISEGINSMGKTLRLGSIRYCEAQNEIAFLFGRKHHKFPLFDEDQEPRLHGDAPKQGLCDLYQATVNNTERAISQNIDYATTLLSRMQLIKNRLIPIMPHSHEEWEDEASADHEKVNDVLKRIDDLMYIRRERTALLDMKLI